MRGGGNAQDFRSSGGRPGVRRRRLAASPLAAQAKCELHQLAEFHVKMVTFGTLVSKLGSMNGNIFITAQVPVAAALDGLAPKSLAQLNRRGAPALSLIVGSVAASVLLLAN